MDNTIVTLNLRGTKFQTLKSTFDNLDLVKFPPIKVGENKYFIDKDPTDFHSVLDCAGSVEPIIQLDDFLVTLNVRGTKFQTMKSTLDNLDLNKVNHLKINDAEYFINRDPKYFHLILDYASTEKSMCEIKYDEISLLLGVAEDDKLKFFNETKFYGICHCNIYWYRPGCKKHGMEKSTTELYRINRVNN